MIVFLIDERYINHFYFVPKNKLRPEDRSGPVVRSKIIFLDNVDGLLKRKEFAVPFCKVCRGKSHLRHVISLCQHKTSDSGVSLEAIEKKVLETESRFRLMKYRYMSAKTNKDIIASMSCVELYLLPTTAEDKKVRPQHPESRVSRSLCKFYARTIHVVTAAKEMIQWFATSSQGTIASNGQDWTTEEAGSAGSDEEDYAEQGAVIKEEDSQWESAQEFQHEQRRVFAGSESGFLHPVFSGCQKLS